MARSRRSGRTGRQELSCVMCDVGCVMCLSIILLSVYILKMKNSFPISKAKINKQKIVFELFYCLTGFGTSDW